MKALDRAIAYLNIKPRTKLQIKQYLDKKGCDSKEVEEAISILEEYGYIDDLNFACRYFELGFEKGHGIFRIKKELAGKGVSKDVIDKALDSVEDVPDQFLTALDIGRQIVPEDAGEMDYETKQKLRGRIARRLAGRGFSSDIAYRAAKELVK